MTVPRGHCTSLSDSIFWIQSDTRTPSQLRRHAFFSFAENRLTLTDGIVATIWYLDNHVVVADRGAYLRVLALRRCVAIRTWIERHLGRAVCFPGELETVMSVFRGILEEIESIGTSLFVKAVTAEAGPHPLLALILPRATLHVVFLPCISDQLNTHLLAYCYSATMAGFYSTLDTQGPEGDLVLVRRVQRQLGAGVSSRERTSLPQSTVLTSPRISFCGFHMTSKRRVASTLLQNVFS